MHQDEERGAESQGTAPVADAERQDLGNETGREAVDVEEAEGAALFTEDERGAFQERWSAIQTRFVDEPQRAVEEANELVQDLVDRLVGSFREQQARLEEQWRVGDEVTTESLRVTLQRYRSFFGRLLEV